jgi:hypothetical protein
MVELFNILLLNIGWEYSTFYEATPGYVTTGLPNHKYIKFKINWFSYDTTNSVILSSIKQNYAFTDAYTSSKLILFYENGSLFVSGTSPDTTSNDFMYEWDENKAWWKHNIKCNATENYLSQRLIADTTKGSIYNLNNTYNDAGETINFYAYSGQMDYGNPYRYKSPRMIYLNRKSSTPCTTTFRILAKDATDEYVDIDMYSNSYWLSNKRTWLSTEMIKGCWLELQWSGSVLDNCVWLNGVDLWIDWKSWR